MTKAIQNDGASLATKVKQQPSTYTILYMFYSINTKYQHGLFKFIQGNLEIVHV